MSKYYLTIYSTPVAYISTFKFQESWIDVDMVLILCHEQKMKSCGNMNTKHTFHCSFMQCRFASICISRVQCIPQTSVRQQYTLDSSSNWNILLRNERISFGEYRKIWCYGFRSCKYNVCHPAFTIDPQ